MNRRKSARIRAAKTSSGKSVSPVGSAQSRKVGAITTSSLSQQAKRILYYGPSPQQFERFVANVSSVSGCRRVDSDGPPTLLLGDLETSWLAEHCAQHLHDVLRHKYVNLVLLDLRCPGDQRCFAEQAQQTLRVLDDLNEVEDVETRYAFHRIFVLLPESPSERVDRLILDLGQRGVRTVLRPHDTSEDRRAFARVIVERIREALLVSRGRGQRTLCAAGGGITGIYFEMGALKCLDDCMPGQGVNGFDMYFGISAGAVVMGALAVGYSIDEYLAAVAGHRGGRIPPFSMALFRLGHVDYREFARRVSLGLATGWSALWQLLRWRRSRPSLEGVFFQYADLVGAPFKADRFERMLSQMLSAPGSTNDFRQLSKRLFIGVTDQDARQHVLFGDEANDEVPISLAIQASMSLNPAFTATMIRGRYYEDGAVTRTSNFIEAIRRGSTLVFVVDPFVPYVSHRSGFASRRGVLYNVDQDIRTVSYTRFENTRNWVMRQHPEVSSYTFLPANRLRRLLSVSPFDHRPYLQIWRGAYLSTLTRVMRMRHRMAGDLTVHGLTFDTSKAEAVADRLRAADEPSFADFFPNGRIELRCPPLCLERPTGVPTGQPEAVEALAAG